eukprot:g49943.t1
MAALPSSPAQLATLLSYQQVTNHNKHSNNNSTVLGFRCKPLGPCTDTDVQAAYVIYGPERHKDTTAQPTKPLTDDGFRSNLYTRKKGGGKKFKSGVHGRRAVQKIS